MTSAGALLVPKADSLLAEAESLARSLREERSEPRGLVRMTATPEMGAHFIERVVPVLAREHPGIRIAMALGYGLEDILDPAIDVALRVGAVRDDRLVAHRIGGLRWVTVASGDYLASNPVRRVSDLTQRRCLVFSATDVGAEWTFTRRDLTERVTVTSALSVAGSTALLHAARAGLGVARVVEPVAEDWLRRGELVRVLPGWASPEMPVLVVHRFGHDRIARVGAVLRAVRGPWLQNRLTSSASRTGTEARGLVLVVLVFVRRGAHGGDPARAERRVDVGRDAVRLDRRPALARPPPRRSSRRGRRGCRARGFSSAGR